jgi:hypothetical protein
MDNSTRIVRRGNPQYCKNSNKGSFSKRTTKVEKEVREATIHYHHRFLPKIKFKVERIE